MASKVGTHISVLVGVPDCWLPKLHCRPADGVLDCKGPLSGMIAPNILAEK